jgi:hypothetical protein
MAQHAIPSPACVTATSRTGLHLLQPLRIEDADLAATHFQQAGKLSAMELARHHLTMRPQMGGGFLVRRCWFDDDAASNFLATGCRGSSRRANAGSSPWSSVVPW